MKVQSLKSKVQSRKSDETLDAGYSILDAGCQRSVVGGLVVRGPVVFLRAFTLIELLVVIAIMAILAALIIPGAAAAKAARMRGRAKTELNQIAAMVESYKSKLNFYPPSAANSSTTNIPYSPLYY